MRYPSARPFALIRVHSWFNLLAARRPESGHYAFASRAAIWAVWRPWKRAMASSFSLGWRDPSPPAMVVAP